MPTLKKGSSGPKVKNLQQRLKELGFDPHGIDGKFGLGTQTAVLAFQKANGLDPDGMVGPKTTAALNSTGNKGNTSGTTPAAKPAKTTTISGSTLTEDDFKQAAELLKCEVAAIKAVAEVESRGAGFMADGRPTILFERHKFHAFTNGAFAATHPDISRKSAGGYGAGGAHQWDRFNTAAALNNAAAIKACSWGKFQLMGFNFATCGFATLEDFHAAMLKSEGEQLKAFCHFITASGLAGALRNRKWAAFAKGYNGKNYKINKYDTKLAAAYRKHSKP